MSKKLLVSAGTLVFIGALVASATGAFFSDTETSTGNTFASGAIDLTIDSVAHYNGMICALDGENYVWVPEASAPLDPETMQPVLGSDMDDQDEWDAYNLAHPAQYPPAGMTCTGTWPLANLDGEGEGFVVGKFFDFLDIKPGDQGENTVSIHIDSNDAWMCVDLANIDGADLDGTKTEPEVAAGDVTFADDLAASELDENLHFFAWLDDGDNIFEAEETELGQATASELQTQTWALADSTTGNGPIKGDETQYIGLYWCAGDISVVGNTLSCDGEAMGNSAQTDSWSADLNFYVEQSRNNPDFRCEPNETEPTTGSITIDKLIAFSDPELSDVDVTDFTFTLTGPGGAQVVMDEVVNSGLVPGAYTIEEVYTGDEEGLLIDAVFSGACTEDGSLDGDIMLAAGESLTCTITNNLSLDNG